MHYRFGFKRFFDIVGAIVLFVLLFPILAVVFVSISMTMGRPAIFRQYRPGRNETEFPILKFRTMSEAKTLQGKLLPDGERITKLGAFLRKTSLDELPSLINVLKGEMSFIGPRPLLTQYLPVYTREERLRFLMRPGITGLAQVSGRNNLDWDTRLAIDVDYVKNCSLVLDLQIVFKTIVGVFSGKDVAVDTDTVEPFLDEERAQAQRISNDDGQ